MILNASVSALHGLLSFSGVYNFAMKSLGRDRAVETFVSDCLQARPGEKILDAGCGTGTVLNFLPDVNYVGIDTEQKYIDFANQNFGSRGTFLFHDVSGPLPFPAEPQFDAVIAVGVLHHLSDSEVHGLLKTVKTILKPGGRFCTLDGCFTEPQNPLDRWMLEHDRGRYVRNLDGYVSLVNQYFGTVSTNLRTDLFAVKHTILMMRCDN